VLGGDVHALDVVDSTQAVLADLARAGAPEGTVVTARHQTAGRGRRGHHWWDAPGESLLCSVLLRPLVRAAQAPQLALVAGVAVTDALESVSVTARIRWPNDILVDGRKIAGILPEGASDPDGRLAHVLLGIGINLEQTDFPDEIAGRATSFRLVTGRTPDRDRMLDELLGAVDRHYRAWCREGFAAVSATWRRRSTTIGTQVRLPDGRDGLAMDVDADGALIVDVGRDEVIRLSSGELAWRP